MLGAEAVRLTLLLLVGGVWADRLPRVRVMVTADVVSFVSQGTTAVLLIAGSAEVWQLAALAAVGGAADAFHTPAWAGLLPETVAPSMLQRADALRHLESNACRVAGPLIADVIIAVAGTGWAIAADALSFLLAAAILVGVRPNRLRPPAERRRLVGAESPPATVSAASAAACSAYACTRAGRCWSPSSSTPPFCRS